jgi:ABC-type Fe3+ transport system permease subunit
VQVALYNLIINHLDVKVRAPARTNPQALVERMSVWSVVCGVWCVVVCGVCGLGCGVSGVVANASRQLDSKFTSLRLSQRMYFSRSEICSLVSKHWLDFQTRQDVSEYWCVGTCCGTS